MTDTGKQISNLMMDTGKSAADMTHAMKNLGNGSMQRGLARIGRYFVHEAAMAASNGRKKGRIEGGIIGALGMLFIGGIAVIVKQQKKKKEQQHEMEGQVILKTMQTEMTDESVDSIDVDLDTEETC